MFQLYFPKLYKDDCSEEPCTFAFPLAQGALQGDFSIAVTNEEKAIPVQYKVTSRWPDGSVRWIFVRCLADLKGNAKSIYTCSISAEKAMEEARLAKENDDGVQLANGVLDITLQTGKNFLKNICFGGLQYESDCFEGPVLTAENGKKFDIAIDKWKIVENGPLCAVVKGLGANRLPDGQARRCHVKLTMYRGKPWVEVAYCLTNTSYTPLHIEDLSFYFHAPAAGDYSESCVAWANYATEYKKSSQGDFVEKVIDAKMLLREENEHKGEVFHGTLFADYRDSRAGLCATVYQAHQNFPKAVSASADGWIVRLVPAGVDKVVMEQGMAREQRFLLHFHDPKESYESLNDRSIRYQMPDRPQVPTEVYQKAGVFEDVFVQEKNQTVEQGFILSLDRHARCYGMLNWGDAPDPGYTQQGRGNGANVWTNNEYDFSHASTLMYVRTGHRRFLDYMLVSSRHWMDVDICHFHDDPLVLGGQWEHAARHCIGSHMACSHEWVAGLLDYYHFTGDEDAFAAAVGIGENVVRLLNSPQFQDYGALHARESGWALRTLGDLYKETADETWLEKCEWIVGHFESWEKKYGGWLAPYTDNTLIRVVFMISIAVGSLMRYQQIRPSERGRGLILRAVDDMLENCQTETGLFYYKELPSLQKPSGPMILEALAFAYYLTGDKKYLTAGLETFRICMPKAEYIEDLTKRAVEDTVIHAGEGTKTFAQSFLPLVTFYKAATEADIPLF